MKSGNIDSSRSNGSKRIRVLMADPDDSLQPMYRGPLLQEGYDVDWASNGMECVSRLYERVPDILLLEPDLPWGGGDGVLSIMGEDPDLAIVPVMVLTSCRNPRILKAIARFPVRDYQLKPLTPDRLVKRLRNLLDHPRLRFTMAEQTGRLECSIASRTGGRVENLCVENVDGRVIVQGRVHSPHAKQLALAAVLEVFEASQSQSERVELDIEVVSDGRFGKETGRSTRQAGRSKSLEHGGLEGCSEGSHVGLERVGQSLPRCIERVLIDKTLLK